MQGLGEALLQLFHDDDAVIPGLLQTGLFTVGSKNNIDKNACCTIYKFHYHGTSMSLFQFPSSFNNGFKRNYSNLLSVLPLRAKKEVPSFYTDV